MSRIQFWACHWGFDKLGVEAQASGSADGNGMQSVRSVLGAGQEEQAKSNGKGEVV